MSQKALFNRKTFCRPLKQPGEDDASSSARYQRHVMSSSCSDNEEVTEIDAYKCDENIHRLLPEEYFVCFLSFHRCRDQSDLVSEL